MGLLTKTHWAGWGKGVLLLALSTVGGFLTSALDASDAGVIWDWKLAALTSVATFVSAVASYFGVLKDTKLASAAQNTLVR